MKNRRFSTGSKCRPHEATFFSPMKVGLKNSCLPCANVSNLRTDEKLETVPKNGNRVVKMSETLLKQILKLLKKIVPFKNMATSFL
jgi:hypothetical protein